MKYLILIFSLVSSAAFGDPHAVNGIGADSASLDTPHGLISGFSYDGNANGAAGRGGLALDKNAAFCKCNKNDLTQDTNPRAGGTAGASEDASQ